MPPMALPKAILLSDGLNQYLNAPDGTSLSQNGYGNDKI